MTKEYSVLDKAKNKVTVTQDVGTVVTPEYLTQRIASIDAEITRLTQIKTELQEDLAQVTSALAVS